MNYIQETVEELKARIDKAKGEIAIFEKCVALLVELVEEPKPETPPDNSHEDDSPEPDHQAETISNFVGVYPVGKTSKKWYASVTERGKTKRLCGTYDTPEEASAARSEYLANRDGEPAGSGSGQGPKHILSPSNEAAV